MNLLSIDPGKRSLAWALWTDGTLVAAELEKHKAKDWAGSIHEMAEGVDWSTGAIVPDLVLVELPRVYPHSRDKRPNDLIDLAAVAGACAALGPLEFVHPRGWKGQTPKHISAARSRGKLTPKELGRVQTGDHNVWDAVGIGLWYLEKERIRT